MLLVTQNDFRFINLTHLIPWVKSNKCVIYRVGCTPEVPRFIYIILKVKARRIRCTMLSGCEPVQVPCIHPHLREGCVERFLIPNAYV